MVSDFCILSFGTGTLKKQGLVVDAEAMQSLGHHASFGFINWTEYQIKEAWSTLIWKVRSSSAYQNIVFADNPMLDNHQYFGNHCTESVAKLPPVSEVLSFICNIL